MWLRDDVGIGEEHFVTATTKMVMSQIVQLADRQPSNGLLVLTSSVEGNAHDIGTHAVADFFEIAGWRAVNLGSDVPKEALVQCVRDYEPDLLVLAATLDTHRSVVQETVQLLRHELNKNGSELKIMIGGGAFDQSTDPRRMGADVFAADPFDAVVTAHRLFQLPEVAGL